MDLSHIPTVKSWFGRFHHIILSVLKNKLLVSDCIECICLEKIVEFSTSHFLEEGSSADGSLSFPFKEPIFLFLWCIELQTELMQARKALPFNFKAVICRVRFLLRLVILPNTKMFSEIWDWLQIFCRQALSPILQPHHIRKRLSMLTAI